MPAKGDRRGRTKAAAKRGPKKARTPPRQPARRSALVRLAYWGLIAGIWSVVAVGGLVATYAYDLPDIGSLTKAHRSPGITVTTAEGTVVATYGQVYAGPVTLEALPAELPRAVLATEDRRFYSHFGLDWIGLVRAAFANLKAGRVVQGGSTLTQQIAKNVFLSPARTVRRKVQELLLALWLEHRFTKDQLLTIYLNRVYLGAGAYGVEAASQRYFGKSARDLTLAESAMIAGLLKAPSRYAPTRDLARAQARAGQVLDNMVAAGLLAPEGAATAKAAPATATGALTDTPAARYFADWVIEQLPSYLGPTPEDLILVTTLDARAQQAAEDAIAEVLNGAPEAAVGEAALVALDSSGAVRAMVGGRSYVRSQFNRATQARRQPGSAFKLFVYLAGIEAGMSPDDRVTDSPVEIEGWSPRNYDGRFHGPMRLGDAFAQSSNVVAVKVAEQAGRDQVIRMAHRLGITADLPAAPSVALGAAEVSLIELTAAYGVIANQGRAIWPYGIDEIRGRDGAVLYRRQGSGPGPVLEQATVSTMDHLLRVVVSAGTGKQAQWAGPAAGKTGTSQDWRDAWFIGYGPRLVAGVWLGNDDSKPMNKVTGGGLPARIWSRFMSRAQP
ncbi:MAG: PBP1A family penicillin-binding protein [Alphaproteobacteria bacterium]|jgi:penicillin-binding protein 1A|nr:PBP1A family penicillin-binding protein [Alphaproteobacteria bacterium]